MLQKHLFFMMSAPLNENFEICLKNMSEVQNTRLIRRNLCWMRKETPFELILMKSPRPISTTESTWSIKTGR